MNVKATITLPEELLHAVDEQSPVYGSRSRLVETALRAFLDRGDPSTVEARDLAIIERHLHDLNKEAEDALDYQAPL